MAGKFLAGGDVGKNKISRLLPTLMLRSGSKLFGLTR